MRSLSSACLVLCWSVLFRSQHSCLKFRFGDGVRTLALHVLSCCVSVLSRVRSAVHSSVHVCFVVLHAFCDFISCVHSCYVLCCVACSLCFSLAACIHVVMSCVNVAYEYSHVRVLFCTWLVIFVLLAMCFFLCEHMACLVWFYVPCALMSIVLTPPYLLPDYWLICPTCLSLLPSSFALFIIPL